MRTLAVLSLAAALVGCAAGRDADEAVGGPGDPGRGMAMVEAHCSGCHATGLSGKSPYAGAPPLRDIAARGHIDDYAEAFAEGIIVPHKGRKVMPEFVLNPREIEDLLAYLKTLQK
jgi:mono/diheme cytochrome c family protein